MTASLKIKYFFGKERSRIETRSTFSLKINLLLIVAWYTSHIIIFKTARNWTFTGVCTKGYAVKNINENPEVRRAWTAQLYNEHESICWHYKVKMSTPVIEMVEAKSFWGKWCKDSESGTIKLSLNLIKEHPWNIVINVLKHEMAHQIVTELFKSPGGHGVIFKKACLMIGLCDEFTGSQGDLPEILDAARKDLLDPKIEKILEKVRKLLSLASSKNEYESTLAMQKANEFIKKYNLERVNVNKHSKYVYKIINHRKKRIENYQRAICSILQDYFFVRIVYSYLYDQSKQVTHRTIEILGSGENVVIAEYVYYFLLNQLDYLWKAHRAGTKVPGKEKRSYWLGVLAGFHEKLGLIDKKQHFGPGGNFETTSALICTGDKMLSDYVKVRFPRLRRSASSGFRLYEGTYNAGVSDGGKLNLHKGISETDGYQGRLLTVS